MAYQEQCVAPSQFPNVAGDKVEEICSEGKLMAQKERRVTNNVISSRMLTCHSHNYVIYLWKE